LLDFEANEQGQAVDEYAYMDQLIHEADYYKDSDPEDSISDSANTDG